MDPFAQPLVQPDQRTCGAAVLVVAHMLHDEDHATYVDSVADFEQETLTLHRRITGAVDARGRAQLPWPRALGTPPWSVARELSAITGTTYRPRPVLPWNRTASIATIEAAARAGHLVPLYVGNRWLPRHVVLLLDYRLRAYDPARGGLVRIDPARFVAGSLLLSGWTHPWLAVLPVR